MFLGIPRINKFVNAVKVSPIDDFTGFTNATSKHLLLFFCSPQITESFFLSFIVSEEERTNLTLLLRIAV